MQRRPYPGYKHLTEAIDIMPTQHYSPALDRFLIKALYHEAKQRRVPMTRLANQIVQHALAGTTGWKQAEEETVTVRTSTCMCPAN